MIPTAMLTRHGFTPPPPGSTKTTCPQCSDFRVKRDERCLRIRPTREGFEVFCYHCQYEREFYAV